MASYTVERMQGRAGVKEEVVQCVRGIEGLDAERALRSFLEDMPDSSHYQKWEFEFDPSADEATAQNPEVDGGPGELTDYWRAFAESGGE